MSRIFKKIILIIVGVLFIIYLNPNSKENETSNIKEEITNNSKGNKISSTIKKEEITHNLKGNRNKISNTIKTEENKNIVGTLKMGEDHMKNSFTQIKITKDIYNRIYGKSYKENCPLPLEDLRYLRLLYYGFDGKIHVGEMIVNKSIAKDTVSVFQELYEAKYPIESIRLVDDYDGDDERSMSANNSSAFNFRYIDGTKTYSNHGKGLAIDINPLYNPYVRTRNGSMEVLPAKGEKYANRHLNHKYYIKKDDICYKIFTKYGFTWGGEWTNSKDYQHFEKVSEER